MPKISEPGWYLTEVENNKVVSRKFLYKCNRCHDKIIEPEGGWTIKCPQCGLGETSD